jgi:hypothetical protein
VNGYFLDEDLQECKKIPLFLEIKLKKDERNKTIIDLVFQEILLP